MCITLLPDLGPLFSSPTISGTPKLCSAYPLTLCCLRHCFCPPVTVTSAHEDTDALMASQSPHGLPAHPLPLSVHLSFPKDKLSSSSLKTSCRTKPKLLTLAYEIPSTSLAPAVLSGGKGLSCLHKVLPMPAVSQAGLSFLLLSGSWCPGSNTSASSTQTSGSSEERPRSSLQDSPHNPLGASCLSSLSCSSIQSRAGRCRRWRAKTNIDMF